MESRFKSEDEARRKAREDLKALLRGAGGRLSCPALQSLREDAEARKEEVDRELILSIQTKVQELSRGV